MVKADGPPSIQNFQSGRFKPMLTKENYIFGIDFGESREENNMAAYLKVDSYASDSELVTTDREEARYKGIFMNGTWEPRAEDLDFYFGGRT